MIGRSKVLLPLHAIVVACAMSIYAGPAAAKVLVVCPAGAKHKDCAFTAPAGVQAAVDKAVDGDTVLLKAGVYSPVAYRDVHYKRFVLRGFVIVERKSIRLTGEQGAILDGGSGPEVSGIVVDGGRVVIDNLTVRNFRAVDPNDDLWDGSGIHIIDAEAAVNNVIIERHAKMGLASRGTALVTATNIRIRDGFVGLLVAESAQIRLCNSIVSNNRAAGVAAYANSYTAIYNSVFDGNLDDGLFGVANATLFATNSLILRNKPYAVRVMDDARAWVGYSVLFGNEAKDFSPEGKQHVTFGKGMIETDPQVTADYRLPSVPDGDPDVRDLADGKSRIGLADVPACLPK